MAQGVTPFHPLLFRRVGSRAGMLFLTEDVLGGDFARPKLGGLLGAWRRIECSCGLKNNQSVQLGILEG